MTVSSRTPEGLPSHCPLCGASVNIEYSAPAADAPCPHCGCLLWLSNDIVEFVANYLHEELGTIPDAITVSTRFSDLNDDSLGTVELAMELEKTYEINISDDDYHKIQTIGDLVRYINIKRKDSGDIE